MGKMVRFTLGAICFCLLVVHYFDRTGHGASAFNFFGRKTCDKNDPSCNGDLGSPPQSTTNRDFFKSAPFLTGVSMAVVGIVLFYFTRRPPHRKVPPRANRLDGTADPALDPYDVIQCLRNRLTATETELAQLKSRDTAADDRGVASADALALVPRWSCEDQAAIVRSKGSKSVSSGRSQRSAKDWSKIDLSSADYVRKCKYMAKKLKESESSVKLLRTQIAMANDIKAEFDDLVEQRGDMGKQIVTLAKEKSEARRKISSLQVEIRTMRKQIDGVNENNMLLSKHNEQLATNLKNSLRDKKLAKRQFDECNEELLLVRKKLDSMHQEKERLMIRIEDLEKRVLKKNETKTTKGKEVGTSTSVVDIKSFERSLMNLERSVEENLRLRKSVESLYSQESSAYGAGDEKIATIRRDLTRMEEIYSVDVHPDSNEMSYHNSNTSVNTKEMSSAEELQNSRKLSKCLHNEMSVCCLDSRCSVCSKTDCEMTHRSCDDIRCVMPYSEMDVSRAGGGRPSVRRAPAIEKLADIFGNEDEFAGVASALRRSKKESSVCTRDISPRQSTMDPKTKVSLVNILQDFTTSEESLESNETFDMPENKASSNHHDLNKNPTDTKLSSNRDRGRTKLNASLSNPALSKKSAGKKMVSCFTSASEDGRNVVEMTGWLNQDPEIGDEDVIGDQRMAQLSESATYVFGARGIDVGYPH